MPDTLSYLAELRLALRELIEGSEQSRDRDTRITELIETCELAIREVTAGPDLLAALQAQAARLDKIADTLDTWARQSLTGGWSTHQVEANTKLADDCRRRAAELRATLARATAHPAPQSPLPASSRNEPGV